jgi:hypothetical protein
MAIEECYDVVVCIKTQMRIAALVFVSALRRFESLLDRHSPPTARTKAVEFGLERADVMRLAQPRQEFVGRTFAH